MNNSTDKPSVICTTCPYCGVGCGVDVEMKFGRVNRVAGTQNHPANLGRLCVKGSTLHETLDTSSRLLKPQVDGEESSWEHALDTIAKRFKETIDSHGPDSVAFYLSGQLLTEDYYVANKLMKGFIGSANVDTNSRLCMSSPVAGYKRAFGSDTVPCDYTDLEQADLLVIAGSNTAWAHPVVYQRIVAAKRQRPHMRVVTIDPRKTATTDISDLHLSLKPKSDSLLFTGLLHYLSEQNCLDQDFIESHTQGFAETQKIAAEHAGSLAVLSEGTGLAIEEIEQFFQWFAATEKTVTLYSQGLNQSSTGTDNANTVINCHLATGRIGKTGAGPFSITGQPNAMGGREVGGLANQLAAHMELGDDAAHQLVSEFWQTDKLARKPGLKAVDLFQAVENGTVKAVWVIGTNPAVSMPDTDRVIKALEKCELLIVSDCEGKTDTTVHANILLPALTWGEKNGTVTNSERCISRQRAFLPAPGEAKADWWMLTQVAQRMGYGSAFNYQSNDQIFKEHAALSAYKNNGSRDFDIGALANISAAEYNAMQPVQWPCPANETTPKRLFADGHFFTPSSRANFIPVVPQRMPTLSAEFPYILNSGRLRDQWHTMTRTAKSPRLLRHTDEPYIEMHPDDAAKEGIADKQLVAATAQNGASYLAKAKLSNKQRTGSLFVPIHWNQQFSKSAKASALLTEAADPISGQPAFKHGAASIAPIQTTWKACVVSISDIATPDCLYWSRVTQNSTQRLELCGDTLLDDKNNWLTALSGVVGAWMTYHNNASGAFRAACLDDNKLQAVVFYTETGELPPRSVIEKLFSAGLTSKRRNAILTGRVAEHEPDVGSIICACHNTGEKTIREAIINGCHSPQSLGKKLGCGTGCGSCLPELQEILLEYPQATNKNEISKGI